ncbi:hypothetical protein Tco_1427638 [Tanacetum coccineum]
MSPKLQLNERRLADRTQNLVNSDSTAVSVRDLERSTYFDSASSRSSSYPSGILYQQQPRISERWVEDLQLGVESYQKKLNLAKPDTFRPYLRKRTAFTAYSDPQGVIYIDKNNKNRLMRTDELYKFIDGTLNSVQTTLHDITSGIRMEYLPKKKWSNLDKRRARVMI